MNLIPSYISVLFTAAALMAVSFFYVAAGRSLKTIGIIIVWGVLHCILAVNGFYLVNNTMPPHIVLMFMPMLIIIIALFVAAKKFISKLDLKWLTLLHAVRIPVEIGLFLLYRQTLVPKLMTFEGGNLDILSGLTAPVVFYFGFVKQKFSGKVILIWNIVCLLLLVNILIRAVLSIQTPFQQLAFDQPNVGVLYFPVILLPAVIVPLVLFSQLAAIKRLWFAELPVK